MKKTIFTVIVCAFIAMTSLAQTSEFAEKTAKVDKIGSWLDFPAEGRNSKNGGGYSTNVDLLEPKPKKVALVSFYLYDPACTKVKSSNYTGRASASAWSTSVPVAQVQSDGFYAKSIDVLKAEFKSYGMDLLTPKEFLDTDEKAEFYYGFSQETAKKEKTERTARGAIASIETGETAVVEAKTSTLKITPSKQGYRSFFVANEEVTESAQIHFMNAGIRVQIE